MSRAPPYPNGVRNGDSVGMASMIPLNDGTRRIINGVVKSFEGGWRDVLKCDKSEGRDGDMCKAA